MHHSNMQSLSPSPETLSSPFLSPHQHTELRTSRSTRSIRSMSAASTTSTSSTSSRDSFISHASPPPAAFYPSSLDTILVQARNSSFTSLTSISLQSIRSERKPSCFSVLDAREEKSLYGKAVGILEPRDSVGWWGLSEVLESEN